MQSTIPVVFPAICFIFHTFFFTDPTNLAQWQLNFQGKLIWIFHQSTAIFFTGNAFTKVVGPEPPYLFSRQRAKYKGGPPLRMHKYTCLDHMCYLLWQNSAHHWNGLLFAVTLWELYKMAEILQKTFSNAFHWKKSFEFWTKYHWNQLLIL